MDAPHSAPNVPDEAECLRLLGEYKTPERVIAHSKAVEKVARRVGGALIEKGYVLDLPTICAAALLHDIARTKKRHDKVGAAYLASLGYVRIGELVAAHMELPPHDRTHITEKTVLFLADKLVSEDTEVTLKERYSRSMQKADPSLRTFIESKYQVARRVQEMVQKALEKNV